MLYWEELYAMTGVSDFIMYIHAQAATLHVLKNIGQAMV